MQRIVLDSDIVIDYTRNANILFEDLLKLNQEKKITIFIPSVVVAELVASKEMKNDKALDDLENLITKLQFVEMDYKIAKLAGSLIRDYQPLKLADAVVAATALTHNAKLASYLYFRPAKIS